MSTTPNYSWNLPDWEISSGQNSALTQIDSLLGAATGKLVPASVVLTGVTPVVVANTAVKSTNKVICSRGALTGTPGHISVSIQDSTSITFVSSGTETSIVNYVVL